MLIPYEQKNKGISVTPHSSQKHAYISVITAAGRTEETPAEKADTQSKASSYCSFIATLSELVMERIANILHMALKLPVLILPLACFSPLFTMHSESQKQLLCIPFCPIAPSTLASMFFLSRTRLNASKQQTKLVSNMLSVLCTDNTFNF